MSARAYRLMLVWALVVGLGLTVLLVRWQRQADHLSTAAAQSGRLQADRDQLAQRVSDLQQQVTALEAALRRAVAPVVVPIVSATYKGRVICVSGGAVWPARWDGTCSSQDRPSR